MKRYAIIWKEVGQTPLEAIEIYRAQEKLPADIPLAYAGRLDPMAEGKLLVLIGEECKKLKKYTGLDKEYEFEILFGFSSDTGDVLGLAAASKLARAGKLATKNEITKTPTINDVRGAAKKFRGTHTFPYPRFSSKTVQGKPLHRWTLENRLDEIEVPKKQSTVYKIQALEVYESTRDKLQQAIYEKIASLAPVTDVEKEWGADFRREPILARWKELFESSNEQEFYIACMSAIVSSGTYIRTLSEKIAEALGTRGLAYSITRTKIGKYAPFSSFGFWIKSF